MNYLKKLESLPKFGKESRSSFRYWFYHWYAYQLTALHLKHWKFKYLFHDIEKPWLKLLWKGDYKKVQEWHRKHNSHHTEYMFRKHHYDPEAMVIDWECSRFTKKAGQLNAYETLEMECEKMIDKGVNEGTVGIFHSQIFNILYNWNMIDKTKKYYPRYLVTRLGCTIPED